MVGLIFKIGAFFAVIIFGILVLLNITNVWDPGTVSFDRTGQGTVRTLRGVLLQGP